MPTTLVDIKFFPKDNLHLSVFLTHTRNLGVQGRGPSPGCVSVDKWILENPRGLSICPLPSGTVNLGYDGDKVKQTRESLAPPAPSGSEGSSAVPPPHRWRNGSCPAAWVERVPGTVTAQMSPGAWVIMSHGLDSALPGCDPKCPRGQVDEVPQGGARVGTGTPGRRPLRKQPPTAAAQ